VFGYVLYVVQIQVLQRDFVYLEVSCAYNVLLKQLVFFKFSALWQVQTSDGSTNN